MSVYKYLRLRARTTDDRPLPHSDGIDLINRGNQPYVRDQYGVDTPLLAAEGTPVQSVARVLSLGLTGVSAHGETFSIGDYVFEINAATGDVASTPGNWPINVNATTDKATQTLTVTDAFTDGDTFTIGSVVYTAKDAANAAGEVQVAANALEQAVAVVNAVNGLDGLNSVHPSVSAAGGGGGAAVLTALIGGVAGNAIATTETFTAAGNVFGAATLTGGAESTNTETVDAVVASITAYNVSGEVPFTAVDAGTAATITCVEHGEGPNGFALAETFANGSLTQSTAGVEGTGGIQGAQLQDDSYLYTLRNSDEANKSYEWYRVAHASF